MWFCGARRNCVDYPSTDSPWSNPAVVHFCAIKDVVGALGGPSSSAPPNQFIETPNRFEFSQPEDCPSVGPIADGKHDGCAVVTGAETLLRAGLPVRLFGVRATPADGLRDIGHHSLIPAGSPTACSC
jgi:hypothetical protein